MSHNIYTMQNGQSATIYRNQPGWHGLGSQIPEGATIDQLIELAGFDYTIERAPVQYQTARGMMTTTDREAFFRSDDGQFLAVHSPRYQIVQPKAVMEFFRDLCEEHNWLLETAGVLGGGEKYWAMAKTPIDDGINGDHHKVYVVLATSCDGTMATVTVPTAVRVVCDNTLQAAMYNDNDSMIRVVHSTKFDPDKVKTNLGLIDVESSWNHLRDQLASLQKVEISKDQARDFFSELLRPKSQRAAPRTEAKADSLEALLDRDFGGGVHKTAVSKPEREIRGLGELIQSYESAPGATPGNAYGLIQGITHWVDHSRGRNYEGRFQSGQFGQGAALKQKALNKALSFVEDGNFREVA